MLSNDRWFKFYKEIGNYVAECDDSFDHHSGSCLGVHLQVEAKTITQQKSTDSISSLASTCKCIQMYMYDQIFSCGNLITESSVLGILPERRAAARRTLSSRLKEMYGECVD